MHMKHIFWMINDIKTNLWNFRYFSVDVMFQRFVFAKSVRSHVNQFKTVKDNCIFCSTAFSLSYRNVSDFEGVRETRYRMNWKTIKGINNCFLNDDSIDK